MEPIWGESNSTHTHTHTCMVILRDVPFNNALFGLLIFHDSCSEFQALKESSPWNFTHWFNGVWFNDVVSFLKHFCHFCDMLFFSQRVHLISHWTYRESCPVQSLGIEPDKPGVFFFFVVFLGAIFITQGLAQKGHEESLRLLKLRLGGPLGFVPWRHLDGGHQYPQFHGYIEMTEIYIVDHDLGWYMDSILFFLNDDMNVDFYVHPNDSNQMVLYI